VLFADWILPVDGDELKVRCKYCNRVLAARFQKVLQHSLSNKHLCNAAAATTVSFPSEHLSQDDMVIDTVCDETNTCADKLTDGEHLNEDTSCTTVAVTDSICDRRKVGMCCLMLSLYDCTLNLELLKQNAYHSALKHS